MPLTLADFPKLKPCIAKDYAKKKKGGKKKGASRGKKQSASFGLIFTTFILVAGLIALLVYLKWYQTDTATQIKTSQQKNEMKDPTQSTKKTPHKNPKVTKKVTHKKPADEVPFYQTHEDMLNKTVDIPAEDLELPNTNNYQYLMPCGSFRDLKRADELKAQIAFAGYESNINSIDVKSGKSKGLWHRVELGPFKSKRKAESIRHRLQDNGLNYCKIWPKKIK